jgi:hypothetical protein
MTGQRQDNASSQVADSGDRLTLRQRWVNFWSHPRTRATLRHPLFPMAVLVAVCLIVEECYPFSDFPMYSNLSPGSHYFHLVDENDQALPIKALFGISASEFKKIYHSKLTPMAYQLSEEKGQRIRASDLGPEEQATAGNQLLDQLMPRIEGRKWWKENHPSELRLIRTDIHRNDKELTETPRPITVRKLTPLATSISGPQRVTGVPPFPSEPDYLRTPTSELLTAA